MSQRTERGHLLGKDQGVTEHTNDNVESAEAYAAPAIERREDVSGLLGKSSRGSYCPPTTVKTYFHR